jgi:hypothetical protein
VADSMLAEDNHYCWKGMLVKVIVESREGETIVRQTAWESSPAELRPEEYAGLRRLLR